MAEPIIIEKIPITHKQRAWIRTLTKKKKPNKPKKPIIKLKLSPMEKLKQKKIKKRIYDLDYYWKNKEEINRRHRINYRLCKEDSNTKFI